MEENLPYLESVTWDDVRQHVKKVAPDIFQAIERLNPDKSYKLYLAGYPFGEMIIGEDGLFNLPHNGQVFPITNNVFSKKLQEELGYSFNGIPMALILAGQVELFTEEYSDEIQTDCCYGTGTMLALRGLLDPGRSFQSRQLWRMTSGARTTVMLASLSDYASFER